MFEFMKTDAFANIWNTWQARYLIWWGYSLAILEVVDILVRKVNPGVELISMTAKRLAFTGFTALAFFFGSMTFHWFVTWKRATWPEPLDTILGVFFWLVFVAYMLASWFDPTPKYWPILTQWLRYPPVAAIVGAVLAYVCFPQRSNWFPGRPW